MTSQTEHNHAYTAYYCEENIWHLSQEALFQAGSIYVVFISNARYSCPLWYQRACPVEQEPVLWDYHVILLNDRAGQGWEVWDLDTLLGLPVPLHEYLTSTFLPNGALVPTFEPMFKLIDAQVYRNSFHSDRSHMRKPDGTWLVRPPDWTPISAKPGNPVISLQELADMNNTAHGQVLDLFQLLEHFEVVQ
jgi:hypothetical protein